MVIMGTTAAVKARNTLILCEHISPFALNKEVHVVLIRLITSAHQLATRMASSAVSGQNAPSSLNIQWIHRSLVPLEQYTCGL
ncbi:hypothetical protein SUGI_0337070 [Cryptomeria japonica]|nr:hypothetical protein SUGI_0337070 [Cryptomeria japonica]